MDNYFTHTLANLCFKAVADENGTDENAFISDLFNDEVAEVGHIQLVPTQNRLRINVSLTDGEVKNYNILEPRVEFLRFIFDNSNVKVKKAIRFYFQNSPNAQEQHEASKRQREAVEN